MKRFVHPAGQVTPPSTPSAGGDTFLIGAGLLLGGLITFGLYKKSNMSLLRNALKEFDRYPEWTKVRFVVLADNDKGEEELPWVFERWHRLTGVDDIVVASGSRTGESLIDLLEMVREQRLSRGDDTKVIILGTERVRYKKRR